MNEKIVYGTRERMSDVIHIGSRIEYFHSLDKTRPNTELFVHGSSALLPGKAVASIPYY